MSERIEILRHIPEHMRAQSTILLGAGFSYGITSSHLITAPDDAPALPLGNMVFNKDYVQRTEHVPLGCDVGWYRQRGNGLFEVLSRDFGAVWDEDEGWRSPISAWSGTSPGGTEQQPLNFEVVYSHCVLMEKNPALLPTDRIRYTKCIHELLWYLSKLFDYSLLPRAAIPELLLQFYSALDSRTNIFTTNQDTIFENTTPGPQVLALPYDPPYRVQTTYSIASNTDSIHRIAYGIAADQPANLYKLHGSADWLSCPNEHCRGYVSPLRIAGAERHSEYNYCDECGSALQPEILAPTISKYYHQKTFYGRMLRHLWASIYFSRYLIVIGYRFAEYDTVLTSFIADALRTRNAQLKALVVDPSCIELRDFISNLAGTPKVDCAGVDYIDDLQFGDAKTLSDIVEDHLAQVRK